MKLAKDKLYHAIAGAIVAAAIVAISGRPELGILVATIAGVAKEGYDGFMNWQAGKNNPDAPLPHTVDLEDLIATIVGGVIGAGISSWIL